MNPDLEALLSQPSAADVAALGALEGDLLILGVAGKMGPSLARLAHRGSELAGRPRRIIGVARFSVPGLREALERDGIETVQADLLDRREVDSLPDSPNVVFLVGQKFGTSSDQPLTWATNSYAAALVAERFAHSRTVVFSTGNVYPLTPVTGGGSRETDHPAPVGEYAQSALGRERIFQFFSIRRQSPTAILRLNYAIEPRYGVLRDVADRVRRREPIDLTTGYVNVIWQRDANSVALRALAHCATPPLFLNVTGPETVAIRTLAGRFGSRWGIEPVFRGAESGTALLSNAGRCVELFGPPETGLNQMIEQVAEWIEAGGGALGKPTHYEEREGNF